MKLSVIITFYNNSIYLENVIKNIQNITEEDIEIIVIDDGSNKEELARIEKGILQLNKDNLIFVKNSKNFGAGQTKNKGIKKARGKYISFLDCDDHVDKDYYKKIVNVIDNYNCDIICTNIANIYDKIIEKNNIFYDNIAKISKKVISKNIYYIDSNIILGNKYSGSACNKAIKKSIISKYNFANNKCDDLTAIIPSVCNSKKVFFIDNTYYYYVQTGNSLTRSDNIQYYYDSINSLIATYDIIKNNQSDDNLIELFCATNIINFIYYNIINNSFKKFIILLNYFIKENIIENKYFCNNKYIYDLESEKEIRKILFLITKKKKVYLIMTQLFKRLNWKVKNIIR